MAMIDAASEQVGEGDEAGGEADDGEAVEIERTPCGPEFIKLQLRLATFNNIVGCWA